MSTAGVPTMPKKKSPGRPPEPEPLKSLVSLKGTEAMEKWLDDAVEHSRYGTRTLFLKNVMREWAERNKFRDLPKR